MRRLLNGCNAVLVYTAVTSTFVMMCLTTVDAAGRYIFNRPVTGAYEITTYYLLAVAVFLSAGYTYCEGGYIRVTFFVARLPQKVKLAVNTLAQVGSILYSVLLVITTSKQALRMVATTENLGSLDIPSGPAYVLVPVGFFVMFLLMLIDLPRVKTGRSALFKEESPTS
jgi:TRAP-type transport system small permease protein